MIFFPPGNHIFMIKFLFENNVMAAPFCSPGYSLAFQRCPNGTGWECCLKGFRLQSFHAEHMACAWNKRQQDIDIDIFMISAGKKEWKIVEMLNTKTE